MHSTNEFLYMFFKNLLYKTKHELKNRYMHIEYQKNTKNNVGVNVGVNLSKTDKLVFECLKDNSSITIRDIAISLGLSTRTIERSCKKMKDLNMIFRDGADKNGVWKVNK